MVYLPAGRQARSLGIMYYVYVLYNKKKNKTYKGITASLVDRLYEHDQGRCKSTKSILPLSLVHVEVCENRKEARYLEKYYKSGYGREILKQIINERMW